MLTLAISMAVLVASLPVPTSAASAPYRVGEYEFAEVCAEGLPWTGDPPLALPGPKPRDERGVPLYRVNGRLYYRPGALAINGMKRIDAYRDSVSIYPWGEMTASITSKFTSCAPWRLFKVGHYT